MNTPLLNRTPARMVRLPINRIALEGELCVPPGAGGIVIFAHGSGSSRHSVRNQFVAQRLHARGLATLLFDLLTEAEDRTYANRFDIDLLTERLAVVTDWVTHSPLTTTLTVGYFGASTGAAAAIQAAAATPATVRALVSRGGRVDLAGEALEQLRLPTLLIVGQRDFAVRQLNEEAYRRLQCPKELAEIPDATHLFEEPGTLEQVAELATAWFAQYLPIPTRVPASSH